MKGTARYSTAFARWVVYDTMGNELGESRLPADSSLVPVVGAVLGARYRVNATGWDAGLGMHTWEATRLAEPEPPTAQIIDLFAALKSGLAKKARRP